MDELKKPSMRTAILITLAALLDLFASFMMTVSGAQTAVLTVFLFAEMCIIAGAMRAWVKYFKEYVNFEIESRLKPTSQEDKG